MDSWSRTLQHAAFLSRYRRTVPAHQAVAVLMASGLKRRAGSRTSPLGCGRNCGREAPPVSARVASGVSKASPLSPLPKAQVAPANCSANIDLPSETRLGWDGSGVIPSLRLTEALTESSVFGEYQDSHVTDLPRLRRDTGPPPRRVFVFLRLSLAPNHRA